MNRYATLDQASQEMDAKTLTERASDTKAFLWQALAFVSERIDRMTADEFWPRVDTRYFNARGRHILSASVMDVVAGQSKDMHSPLGEITTLTLNGSVISSSNYQADPRGVTPIRRIAFTSSDSWLTYTSAWRAAHSIAGVWVNRERYSTEGWRLSGDTVQNNPLTANGTSITVTGADALTGVWSLPRFQAGQLLRIGTGTDYRSVESITGDVLSVLVGVNGGTGAIQTQNTAIYIWEPEPIVQRAALKWATHLFSRRGITTNTTTTFDGATDVKYDFPVDAPPEVINILIDGGYLPKDCCGDKGKKS